MPFNPNDIEWNKDDPKPDQIKVDEGWKAEEKPPASTFNWFFNRVASAIKDLIANAIHKEEKGSANGVATLDASTKIPNAQIRNATTSGVGITQLNDATNSTLTSQAATANAVKKAYDLANSKANTSVATTSANGLMSSADKTKLNGVATGAEVNQNAFGNVKVGTTTIAADSKTDTLEIVGGANIDVTPDATNDKLTIAATYGVVTTSADGLMAAADKSKLNGIATNANNYSHPSTHPATMITEDSNHRFVTDTEKLVWNAKETPIEAQKKATDAANAAETAAKNYAQNRIAEDYNGDPDITTSSYILTQHANSPGGGIFWHIQTFFYSSLGGNRAQLAVSYNGDKSRMMIRHKYGTDWLPWIEVENNSAIQSLVDNHISSKSNPHGVTKSQVALGSVLNYGIATQAEAEAGASNSKYMTPLRTKQAVDTHATKTDNPHNVTTGQINVINALSESAGWTSYPDGISIFTASPAWTGPTGTAHNGLVVTFKLSSVRLSQEYHSALTNQTWVRTYYNGVWNSWSEVANKEDVERVIETGMNANGNYIRYASGLQICWVRGLPPAGSMIAAGNIYRLESEMWTFPAAFIDQETIVSGSVSSYVRWFNTGGPPYTTYVTVTQYGYNGGSAFSMNIMAIGRWK